MGDQYKLYESGKYNDVPVLTGYNSDEGVVVRKPKSRKPTFKVCASGTRHFADKILAAYPGGETPAEQKDSTRSNSRLSVWMERLGVGSPANENRQVEGVLVLLRREGGNSPWI